MKHCVRFLSLSKSAVYNETSDGRCGRVSVILDDGRTVEVDYWATARRLEIRIGDRCIVKGATSWCNAVQWGHEFSSGKEEERVAREVADFMMQGEGEIRLNKV